MVCVCRSQRTTWEECVLSCHQVGSLGNQSQGIGIGSKHIYPLSHFTGPKNLLKVCWFHNTQDSGNQLSSVESELQVLEYMKVRQV